MNVDIAMEVIEEIARRLGVPAEQISMKMEDVVCM